MIFLTGDTHGVLEIGRLRPDNFPAGQNLTRNDLVIILGDFGLLWSDPPRQEELDALGELENSPWTTLFLDGNHENFSLLKALPEEERFGAPVGVVSPHIFHLRRGYVYTLQNRRSFVFGGARSVDRKGRRSGVSWWRQEIPSEEEFRRGLDSLEEADWKVDWILTHTAPDSILEKTHLLKYLAGDPVSAYLDEILREVEYDRWFCGHLHLNRFFPGDRLHVLRENIMNGETEEVVSKKRNTPSLRSLLRSAAAKRPREGD